jgi:hypothetical protein
VTTASQELSLTGKFNGQAFSVQYPDGWVVQGAEAAKPWGTDTTIVSPTNAHELLRVDVTPNTTDPTPAAAAQPVIAALSKEPGYKQIDLTPGTFQGYQAEHWEFEVRESGVLLHKEDEFFLDASGNSVAVLTQAPAKDYASLTSTFAALRQSLTMN